MSDDDKKTHGLRWKNMSEIHLLYNMKLFSITLVRLCRPYLLVYRN